MQDPSNPLDDLAAVLRAALRDELRAALAEVPERPRPAPDAPQYLTVAEAAAYLRMTPGGVRKWIAAGHLPARTFGKVTRVLRSDLDALLAGQHPAR